MKTAMQQLHEHLVNSWSAPGDLWRPDKIIEKVESMMELEKKNTMENMTEKDLAIKMANRALEVPYADPDSDICTISRQFLRALELTASGSVADPKEEIFVDGDFNDSYEARVKRATGKNMIVSKEHYTALREALKEILPIAESKFNDLSIDDAHSHRMYIALKAIIEKARNLLNP